MPSPEESRIHELEAQVAKLTALVEGMASTPVPSSEVEVVERPTASRRNMLKLAGAAAAGAAVSVVGKTMPAAAADGDPLTLGTGNNAASLTTLVGTMTVLANSATTNPGIASTRGSLVGWDTANDGNLRAGVLGLSGPFLFTGTNQTAHGVIGRMFATAGTGSGVVGISDANAVGVSAGVRARSANGPAVQLEAVFTAAPTTGTWERGALVPDTAGNLWYCTAPGTPGTWVNILSAAGTFVPLSPGRVYDSRLSGGPLANPANRTISVANRIDIASGAVAQANFVPAGAKAITANLSVVNTTLAGFLAVNPGGDNVVKAAAINWFAAGQILNNGLTLTINPTTREVTVIAGGSAGAQTDFVIDVTGYFL